MKKKNKYISYIILYFVLSVLIGTSFVYFKNITINNFFIISENSAKPIDIPFLNRLEGDAQKKEKIYDYKGEIYSKIKQKAKINITVDEQIEEVIFNDEKISLNEFQKLYEKEKLKDYRSGYNFIFNLDKGINKLTLKTKNYEYDYGLDVVQIFSFFEYIIIFLLLVFPLLALLIFIFFQVVDFINKKKSSSYINLNISKKTYKNDYLRYLPLFIIVVGILLRVIYVLKFGYSAYQHDQSGHIEFIKFFAEHFSLPEPMKGWSYSHQPLYYIISGFLYFISHNLLHLTEQISLSVITWFSLILTSISLIISYKFIKLFTDKKFIINVFLGFLSFTPSFIYLSGRINDDVFAYFMSVITLFFLSKFFYEKTTRLFYITLVLTILSILTKLNGVIFSLLFLIILILQYIQKLKNKQEVKAMKIQIFILSLLTIFVVGGVFLRAYVPHKKDFHFVSTNLSGPLKYEEMYSGFYIRDLVSMGQSFIWEKENTNVKYSIPTYQYGTLFFGEYDYNQLFKKFGLLKSISSGTYVFGLIYILGIFYFFYRWKHQKLLHKLFIIPLILNIFLILFLIKKSPFICSNDFRYYAPVFTIISLVISYGLYEFKKRIKIDLVSVPVLMIFILNIFWIISLIVFS